MPPGLTRSQSGTGKCVSGRNRAAARQPSRGATAQCEMGVSVATPAPSFPAATALRAGHRPPHTLCLCHRRRGECSRHSGDLNTRPAQPRRCVTTRSSRTVTRSTAHSLPRSSRPFIVSRSRGIGCAHDASFATRQVFRPIRRSGTRLSRRLTIPGGSFCSPLLRRQGPSGLRARSSTGAPAGHAIDC